LSRAVPPERAGETGEGRCLDLRRRALAKYTPRILAALTKLRVRATFFVIGYLAEANPDLVRQELRLGMTVGNHSYNHPEVPPFAQLPPQLLTDSGGSTTTISRAVARPTFRRFAAKG
jgi:hypothetical protein